jgi:hypothetical protein
MSGARPFFDWRERHEVKMLQAEAARMLKLSPG